MWTKKLQLDTKHAIGGVVVKGTRLGEIGGSIPNNHIVARKMPRLATSTEMCGGWGESLIKYIFCF
jgi:hypothetical protein